MAKKTLYTNETLFKTIVNILKEKGLLPDILDYHLAESIHTEPIKTYEWDCTAELKFGGSEGIYLDVYIEGNIGIGKPSVRLGVFKTLYESREAFYTMAKLQADFIWETRDFVNAHIDDFEWTGFNVSFFKGEKRTMGYSTGTMDRVKKLMTRNLKYDWDYVIITNNENCKDTRITRDDVEKIAFE